MPCSIENKSLLSDIDRTVVLIRTEVAASKLDYAVEYSGEFSIDTYSSISIVPDAGIVYLEHGNSGTGNGNCGDVDVKEGVI